MSVDSFGCTVTYLCSSSLGDLISWRGVCLPSHLWRRTEKRKRDTRDVIYKKDRVHIPRQIIPSALPVCRCNSPEPYVRWRIMRSSADRVLSWTRSAAMPTLNPSLTRSPLIRDRCDRTCLSRSTFSSRNEPALVSISLARYVCATLI